LTRTFRKLWFAKPLIIKYLQPAAHSLPRFFPIAVCHAGIEEELTENDLLLENPENRTFLSVLVVSKGFIFNKSIFLDRTFLSGVQRLKRRMPNAAINIINSKRLLHLLNL